MYTQAIEEEVTVDYTDTRSNVFELDPLTTCLRSASDFEAYIYLEELSGNDVTLELISVVGTVEVSEASKTLTASSSTYFTVSKPVKHRVYATGTASGQLKIAYRVVCYEG